MTITKKTRKLKNRSGKARCDICGTEAPLQEHHIEGRKIFSPNHPSNLCNACGTCHDKIHLDMIIIEGWFQSTEGKELLWHWKGEESFTGEEKETYISTMSSSAIQ